MIFEISGHKVNYFEKANFLIFVEKIVNKKGKFVGPSAKISQKSGETDFLPRTKKWIEKTRKVLFFSKW